MSLRADLDTLLGVGNDLSDAALDLDAAMTPPAAGDVGAAAAVIGDILATFGGAVATLVNGADGAGVTVRETATAYDETDADVSHWLHLSGGTP